MIRLHRYQDGEPVLLNPGYIQSIEPGPDRKGSLIAFTATSVWRFSALWRSGEMVGGRLHVCETVFEIERELDPNRPE